MKASRDRGTLAVTEEDLGLDELQARGVEDFELLFCVRLAWLKGRHVDGVSNAGFCMCNKVVGGYCLGMKRSEEVKRGESW